MPDSTPSAFVVATGLPAAPPLPFVALTKVIGKSLRWAVLRELASGERLMVIEIAKRVGKPPTLISKHLAILRKVGLVDIKQRLYFMPPAFIVDTEKRVVDLGYCVLRLDTIP